MQTYLECNIQIERFSEKGSGDSSGKSQKLRAFVQPWLVGTGNSGVGGSRGGDQYREELLASNNINHNKSTDYSLNAMDCTQHIPSPLPFELEHQSPELCRTRSFLLRSIQIEKYFSWGCTCFIGLVCFSVRSMVNFTRIIILATPFSLIQPGGNGWRFRWTP